MLELSTGAPLKGTDAAKEKKPQVTKPIPEFQRPGKCPRLLVFLRHDTNNMRMGRHRNGSRMKSQAGCMSKSVVDGIVRGSVLLAAVPSGNTSLKSDIKLLQAVTTWACPLFRS